MPQVNFPSRPPRDSAPAAAHGRQPDSQGAHPSAGPQAQPTPTANAAAHTTSPREPSCALWQRLAAHGWDDAQDAHPLSRRLRQATGWNAAHAQRVLQEYRRFLYLAVRRRGRVCPSGAVDEAWHTHLLDTQRYFGDFCPQVLGSTLHHVPSRSRADTTGHQRAYRATLRAYRWAFGQAPPADIWPPPAERFAARWQPVIRRTHWVLPRPAAALQMVAQGVRQWAQALPARAARPWAMALTLPVLLMLGCAQGRLGPQASGPAFVNQYFWVLVALLIVGGWRAHQGQPARMQVVNAHQLDAIDYAYLVGGGLLAVSTGLARLLQRG